MELRYVGFQCNLAKPATKVNEQNTESHYQKLARFVTKEVFATKKNLCEERERTGPELLSEVA
jgi:hypothetical protein